MQMLKKTGLSLVIALSLVACSSDKNDEKTGAKESSTTSAKQDVVFQELLSHVPANTAYLIANNKRVPENVMKAHVDRMKTLFTSLEGMLNSKTEDGGEKEPQEKFALALFDALGKDISVETWKKNGLVANAHSVVYGLDLKPIARMEIASKDAFKAMIAKAETDSGHKVTWESCAGVDCLQVGEEEQKVVFAITDKQLIVTYHDGTGVEALFNHIAGKSMPESTYKVADWKGFVEQNNYSGYGAGFVKMADMMNQLETFAKAEAKKTEGDAFDEAAFTSCFGVAKKHAEYAQELVFGTKTMDEKRIDYEVLLKTTPEVSAVLKVLPNDLQGFKSTADPIFNFGLNVNFANMRDALSQYINFIATTGEEQKCESINPDELRKSIGGLSMAMAMGLGQFKAISVAVDNVEMDEATGQPKKVEAFATVMADDPMALLQMLAMVNPIFATLEVPADGSVVPLPEGLLPPNPVVPTLSLSRKDQALNILVGNDKPALQDIELAKSTFLWGKTDNQRYYNLLGGVMGNIPQGEADVETQEALKLMQAMGDVTGKVSYQMGADDRGLLINYQINY